MLPYIQFNSALAALAQLVTGTLEMDATRGEPLLVAEKVVGMSSSILIFEYFGKINR